MAQWNSKKWARINWKNRPSTATALGATNLNKIDVFLNEVDNQLIDIDTSKLNISTANSMIASLAIDVNSGIITARQLDGTIYTWDLNLEKIPVSFTLSEDGVLTMTTEDGTQFVADIGELIKDYTFVDSDTIGFSKTVAESGYDVTAIVKDGSIKEKHLDPNYLSSIQQDMNTAQTAANDSLTYSKDSQRWAIGNESEYPGSGIDNSKYYSEQSEAAKIAAEKARDEAQAATGAQIATTEKIGVVKPDGTTIGVAQDGTISSIIKAASLLITDTQGLKVESGQETTTQLLIDAIADKIANHIVTNEALASQLADYVSKSMISNQAVNDATKVTGAALSYAQQQEIEQINSNLGGVKSGIDLDNLWDFYIGTCDSIINAPIDGVLYIINIPGNTTGRAYQQVMSVGSKNVSMKYRNAFNNVWREWETPVTNNDITTGGITRLSFTSNTDRIILYYILNDASDSNWYRLYVDARGIKFEKRIDGVTTTIWSK